MKILETTAAPGAIGPYSQGYEANGFVFTSGQIPVDPATGAIPRALPPRPPRAVRMWARFWRAPEWTTPRW